MKFPSRKSALIFASAVALALPNEAACTDVGELLRDASKERIYLRPEESELRQAEELFTRTLRGEPEAIMEKEWRKLGFELVKSGGEKSAVILLREMEGHRTGRGFYLIRRGGLPLLLQMPHSFKDEQTRKIGLQMAMEGRCAVAAWNTVPRWYDRNGRRIDADLAHQSSSYFTALTAAFLRAAPGGTVAQLHGFEAGKRKSTKAARADVIISNGTGSATPAIRRTAACLGKTSALAVLVYPTDVRELGGTTNSIGALMEKSGNGSFVHLEMSSRFRSVLAKDSTARAALNGCLEGAGK